MFQVMEVWSVHILYNNLAGKAFVRDPARSERDYGAAQKSKHCKITSNELN